MGSKRKAHSTSSSSWTRTNKAKNYFGQIFWSSWGTEKFLDKEHFFQKQRNFLWEKKSKKVKKNEKERLKTEPAECVTCNKMIQRDCCSVPPPSHCNTAAETTKVARKLQKKCRDWILKNL